MSYLFTSESVSWGHPDKVCDRISDAITDLYISKDKMARAAVETMATTNRVIIAGETKCCSDVSQEEIFETVKNVIKEIGYDQEGFSWKNVQIENLLHQQSCDIAMGVDNEGAGDQGIMFGYAREEKGWTTEYMPLAISLSHHILNNLRDAANEGLLPDAKSQTTIEYDDNNNPVAIDSIVVSTQHSADMSQEKVHEIVKKYIKKSLPEGWMPEDKKIYINPTGRFVIGGPDGDTGLTGRKIIVDNYGGYAPHGGGAFSGKDPTKVDRSAAYMLRYLAKNIVAAGLAQECLLQISYAIGMKDPLSLYIDCKGTEQVDTNNILKAIRDNIDLTPKGIINYLDLRRPIYTPTSSYGHFGRKPENGLFTWEKTDLSEELKKCF